ncbi:hypothetical protein HUJ05_006461 [Dendroctonus ponderosae]|nr:hypothetical protein HUJ05_006461 [Dendroctonus ponderosae]
MPQDLKQVPLDDLTFPCPQCHQYLPLDRLEEELVKCSCQCLCRLPDNNVSKKDSSIQTSPMFEFVGSIPHIDSDSDDDKESIRTARNSIYDQNLCVQRFLKIATVDLQHVLNEKHQEN